MTEKQRYLKLLRKMDSEFILNSMCDPTPHMRPIHIALHKIVLRERGVLTNTRREVD